METIDTLMRLIRKSGGKAIFIILLLSISLFANSQKSVGRQFISSKFEKFDIHFFDKISSKFKIKKEAFWGKHKKIRRRWGYVELDYSGEGTGYSYTEYNTMNIVKRKIYESIDEFTEDVYIGPFRIFKTYYKNGNIKLKGVSRMQFTIGEIFLFTESGKIDKVINTDSGYIFSYQKVFDFCQIKGINLSNTAMKKIKFENHPAWSIETADKQMRQWNIIVLDGETGMIVKEYQRAFPRKD